MQKTTLDNGLKVLVQENHSAKVAAIQVWVHVGSADETPDEAGIAHVHEHMLFKGTEKRKVGAIASEIEGAGGDINAWTSYDETVYHVTMASRDFPVGLDILADAVQHSTFDSTELERELEVVLEEVRRGNDTPSRVMSENLFKTSFTTHPYSRPVIGYVDTVKSFTREKIVGFYKRWYRPKNMCLVVVGDVNTDDVLKRAEGLFDKSSSTEPLPTRPRHREPSQDKLRTILDSQDIQETHLGVAWHGVEFKNEDTPALDVLSVLLGSGDSSRLFRKLKREQELVNDCYAFAYTPEDPGLVMVGATIHGAGIKPAYHALLKETLRLKREEPTDAEMQKAKTILLSEAVYQKETVQGIARKIGFFELVAGGPDYEDVYYGKVREVSPADVRRVAEKYLDEKAMTVSALLPSAHQAELTDASIAEIADQVKKELNAEYRPRTFALGAEKVAKVKLQNGATLLVREDHAVPLVSVRAVAMGGLLTETPANNGVSHLAGELLVRGTKRFSAEQISEQIDATAGNISGMSGRNSLGLRGDFLKDHWAKGFDLFTSCLLEPSFEAEEFERERKTQVEDIASRQDNMSAVCFDNLALTMWQKHPYRMPVMGTKESVTAMTREQVIETWRNQLRPDRLTIAVVGAVDLADTVSLFERTIGAALVHPDARPPQFPGAEAAPVTARSARAVRKKEQAHLALGFPGVSMKDERRWVLEVLASILGGQGGRLFLELRDKQSLAYSVTAFGMEGVDPGYFAAYIGTAQEKLETAERGLKSELQKVLDAEVSAAELERAQRYLIGTHEIGLQRASARSGTMALNEAYGIGYDDHTKYAARIEAITRKQVREVAQEIIRFDRAVRSVVEVGENAVG